MLSRPIIRLALLLLVVAGLVGAAYEGGRARRDSAMETRYQKHIANLVVSIPLRKHTRALVIGDSISLRAVVDCPDVFNASYGGAKSGWMLDAAPDLLASAPDMVILSAGANDASAEETRANVRRIAALTGVPIWAISPYDLSGTGVRQIRNAYRPGPDGVHPDQREQRRLSARLSKLCA